MKRRIGKFSVPGQYVRLPYDDLLTIQSGMAVLHVESEGWKDEVTFYATGPMFEEVDEFEQVPRYLTKAVLGDDGELTVSFARDEW